VDAAAGWERLAPVPLQTICLRHRPASVPVGVDDEAALAAHNLAVTARVNATGRAYVTCALLGGRQVIRVSVGAERTERAHVEGVWRELREAAAALEAA